MQKNINISTELISILEQIKDSSVIASNLLDLSNDSTSHHIREDCVDYISISNDDVAMLSYLTTERISSIKMTSAHFDYEVWNSKRRYKARPTAVVQKILASVSGRDLEIFANLFKSALGLTKFEFRVVSGSDIRDWYHYSKAEGSGSLGASCMKHDFCQDFLDIYVDNSDVISMLIMLDYRKKLIGRALLWKIGDELVMDRIYTANDEELPYHFKVWAKNNGYIYKTTQKWNNTLFFEENGKTVLKPLAVKLKHWRYGKYPYFDTFKFLNHSDGIICNHKVEDTNRVLISSDGGWAKNDTLEEDFIDHLYHSRCEMNPILYDSETKKLRDHPVYVHCSKAVWSDCNEMYILKEDSFYQDFTGDNFFKPELNCFNKSDIKNFILSSVKGDFNNLLRILSHTQPIKHLVENKHKLHKMWESDSKWLEATVSQYYDSVFQSAHND